MLNFEKIAYKNLCVLIETITHQSINDIEHIEVAYLNYATHFSENLNLLATINLVPVSGRKVLASSSIKSIEKIHDKQKKNNKLKLIIIEMLLRNRNNNEIIEFWDYCSNFTLDEDGKKLSYMPTLAKRLRQAGIRNFLMELGFVSKVSNKDEYFIDGKYSYLLTDLLERSATLTPERLDSIQKKQTELGNRAEKEIIVYEKRKLKEYPKLLNNIRHVAKENVNAGYDIESFCKKKAEKGVSDKIYIEVKAVSTIRIKFYWSLNEIKIAKKLKSNYYLYLLPIGINEQFDIDNLKIIPNPYKSVYLCDDWQKTEELVSVTEKI